MAWLYNSAKATIYQYPITLKKVFIASCYNRTGSTGTGNCAYVWVSSIVGVIKTLGVSSLTALCAYPGRGYIILGSD